MGEVLNIERKVAGPAPQSVSDCSPLPQKVVAFHHQRVLGRYVGSGDHRMSRAAFAARINVTPFAVEKWFHGTEPSSPGLHSFLSASRVLGPAYFNECAAPAGLTGAYRLAPHDVAAPSMLTETLRFDHALSCALEDQRVDHREARTLAPVARALGSKLLELAAQWERAGG